MFIDRRRDSWNGTPRHIRAAAALAGEAAGVALVADGARLPAGLVIIPLAAEVRVHVPLEDLVAHVAVADADAPERAPQQAVERVLAGRVLHADLEHVRAARRAVALDGACGAVARRRGGLTLLSWVASRVASWTWSRGGGVARFHGSLAGRVSRRGAGGFVDNSGAPGQAAAILRRQTTPPNRRRRRGVRYGDSSCSDIFVQSLSAALRFLRWTVPSSKKQRHIAKSRPSRRYARGLG